MHNRDPRRPLPHTARGGGARFGRAVVAGGVAVGLALAGAPMAPAQSAGVGDPGSLVNAVSVAAVTGLTYAGSVAPLGSVLGSAELVGSADVPTDSISVPLGPAPVRASSITSNEVLRVEPLYPGNPDPEMARAEVWTVTSASMQREVRVEVYRAPTRYTSAPVVYFLDGVGSESPSGWSKGMGFLDPDLRAKAVTVVAPTGAPASLWADWREDDPVLGPNKWETFLTEELPPLLASGGAGAAPVPFDDDEVDFGTLGISMGGGPALYLANQHPDMFGAAGSVSGCFSTTDEVGYQNARLTVESRGGDVNRMWGPRDSADWIKHDTVRDPSGLVGQRVYMSAATGLIGSVDLANFGSNARLLLDGHLLEKGSYECTRAMERSLDRAGVEHRVDYDDTGIHNWPVFIPRIKRAMEYILPGLGEPRVAPVMSRLGAVAAEAVAGSSGSAGASGSVGSR